ncbi:unnamed protein product, partial [Rotaria magnacalcarata]
MKPYYYNAKSNKSSHSKSEQQGERIYAAEDIER